MFSQTGLPLPPKGRMLYGGVVGFAKLIGCYQSSRLPSNVNQEQRARFDALPPNLYGFLFDQAQPLPLMPCRGKLKIFEIDVDALLQAPEPAQKGLF